MKWETVIGLEVHAELSTKSKIFCGCSTAYGAAPNTQVCPICAGMPGTLPKLNRAVVEYAMRLGLALNCDITRQCKFDRKNYFYPDLPKAYQVSQLYYPICRDGWLEIDVEGADKPQGKSVDNQATGARKKIGIRQIHMEEDAGKLVHDARGGGTFIDLNRSGMPLLEIVSQPDFRSAAEVIAYLEKLRETLLYLDVCNCKMQEGSLRVDVNLSVRLPGGEMGVRTETKNMNSFKAIARAIEYEIARQIDILEDGGQVVQETRRWDDEKGASSGMRSKENAQDYRYFPDPDLLPLDIDDAWLESVRKNMPELARHKRERYIRDFGISEYAAAVLTVHPNISDLFEAIVEQCGAAVGKAAEQAVAAEPTVTAKAAAEAANLVTGEIMRLMNNAGMQPDDLGEARRREPAEKFAALIAMVMNGKINRNAYRETAEAVFAHNVDPEAYIAEKGLAMINDDAAVINAVEAVITENQEAVADYRAGKEKVFGFLMGQVMKKLGGKGNPDAAKKSLLERLTNTGDKA